MPTNIKAVLHEQNMICALVLASVCVWGVRAVRILRLRGGLDPGGAVLLVLLLELFILVLCCLSYIKEAKVHL